MNAINIIPKKTDSCPVMGDFAYSKKMNVSWANRKVGDIVLFDFNHNGTSDHIGIVIGLNKDGSITTIEGNTGSNNTNGGQVQIRTRYRSQVNYFVRPKYTKDITPQMVIETARAEVGVKEYPKNSNKVKYNQWYYGKNTSAYWCCTFVCWVFAHVKEPEKPLEKPKDKYGYSIPNPTLKKGSGGTRVKELQRFLNWYCNAKLKLDGSFGGKTETEVARFQKTEGIKIDGVFGKVSYAKAIQYLPEPPKVNPKTNADKIVASANNLAWAYGTPKSKWKYNGGSPTSKCKTAMKKYGYDTKRKMSDCGNGANTVVRESGVNTHFVSQKAVKKPFPTNEGFDIVHKGKEIPDSVLKAGDIISYKKLKGQHTLIYMGDGKVCDAGIGSRFLHIYANDRRYNRKNVKKKTIQVQRAK